MRRLMLFSTSTLHGGRYMEYAVPFVHEFFGEIDSILFVPYARPSGITHDRYTELFRASLGAVGYRVAGIHESDDPVEAVTTASAVFIGGGNTFVLLRALYENGLIAPIRDRARARMPYMGSSAGSNVAGRTIGTTNDMPIAYPPSFDALGLVRFNINPHYLDPEPDSTHMGETRETRIEEFHGHNRQPVVRLREGTLLRVEGDSVVLLGTGGARVFRRGQEPTEASRGADLSSLLE